MNARSSRKPTRAAFATLLAMAGVLSACTGGERTAESPLPRQIHGQDLAMTHEGDEAARILEGLHGQTVGSDRNWVGVYGTMEMPTLVYVSRFPSADRATAELDAMVARIDSGTAGFGHHTWFTRNAQTIHSVFGQGQAHYFWAKDADVWWLGAHPMIVRMALSELLAVPPDSIPELGLPMAAPVAPGGVH